MKGFCGFCLSIGGLMILVGTAHGQLQAGPSISMDSVANRGLPVTQTACTDQSLKYANAKATVLQTLNINNATSAQAAGQWFDAPASIEITGATFYAGVPDAASPVTMTVAVYASDAGRLPLGAPLATTTILVDNEIGEGGLATLAQTVSFAVPVAVSGPHVVAVENRTAAQTLVVTNSYLAADGAGEFLASFDLFGTWTLSESVIVGGVNFDADWLIEPIVSFELEPVVTAAPTCLTETATVEFSADSPFLGSRFFNQAAFLDVIDESYVWDFGDGSPTANGAVQSHEYIFAEGSVFQSTLSATLFGWTASCVAEVSIPISTSSSCAFIFSDRFE